MCRERERDQTVLTNILSQSHCLACDLSLKKAKRATENGQDYSKTGETEDLKTPSDAQINESGIRIILDW